MKIQFYSAKRFIIFFVITLFIYGNSFAQETSKDVKDLSELSLEELMNVEITTASNTGEKLSKAPATIIVITEQEIQERGYTEFYDILNDLPGFDLSRAFGDEESFVYTRGYRKTISDQMLFMVDGMVMNYLYSNNMVAFAQYPINNIKQIEVVYGPASAVYGPNAFSGVINIITKKSKESSVLLSTGSNNTNIADVNLNGQAEKINYSFTGRVFSSDGYDFADRNPSIQSKLYTDPKKWGPFINTEYSGYGSKRFDYYLQGDLTYEGLTLGMINWFYESGYGSEFAGDKALNKAVWQFSDATYYAKYEKEITKDLSAKTLFKYRNSETPPTASFIERYSGGVDFSYWPVLNKSISLFQDFSYTMSDKVFINFGFKYEYKKLQKANLEVYGPFYKQDTLLMYPVSSIRIPTLGIDQNNHYASEDRGVYAQIKYSVQNNIDIIAGLRFDYNNIYKEVLSPRVGVVYEIQPGLIAKAFFGTAFLEPTARSLYGGWSGGLSNSDLKPEKMKTFEASLAYTQGNSSNGVDFYYNQGTDAIGRVSGKNVNVGERRMIGAEVYSKWQFNNLAQYMNKFKADIYLSYIKSEEDLTKSGTFTETGNMAPIKMHLVLTNYFTKDISLSLQNRYIDKINTVSSNPVKNIDGWFTTDLYFAYNNLGFNGFMLGVKVYNLLDQKYDHPGYNDASAGIGADAQGNYIPTSGWYTSVLPQPGREIRGIIKFAL